MSVVPSPQAWGSFFGKPYRKLFYTKIFMV
nr:MAG TPA: hypothetical protein [Caudoviricetes sp.]